MGRAVAVSLLVALTFGLAAAGLPGYDYPSAWATVIDVPDGNTIVVRIVGAAAEGWIMGSVETVRYLGSVADPAGATVCGTAARQLNYQMTFGRLVYLEFDQAVRDSDGAVLAYVYLDAGSYFMVNAALVAMGVARTSVAEPNMRYASVFLGLEANATQLGLGCIASP
jgi:endonuclease YncB( thermonuclease family)